MIEATRTLFGYCFLMLASFPIHQSSGLSEISSQFQEATRVDSLRFAIERRVPLLSARRNLVFGPLTFTTGCRPIVFVTTPPQPASNARMMFASDSVGGADASMNGFSKRMPVKIVDRSAMGSLLVETESVHPKQPAPNPSHPWMMRVTPRAQLVSAAR